MYKPKPETFTVELTLEELAIMFCSTPMTPAKTNRAHMRHWRTHDKVCQKLAAAVSQDEGRAIREFTKIFYKA